MTSQGPITPRLCAPAYELGEYADPVDELPELLADPAAAEALTAPAAGFETYRWTDADITELMAPAAQRTLLEAGIDGADVDLVLLATDSLPRDRSAHLVAAGLLEELGMARATAQTVGLMDCATAMMAVGTAAALVANGTARNVLVATGDVADRATGGLRIVAGGAAIASDAAATVLVSADRAGLPVLSAAHHTAPELLRDGVPPQRQLAARIRGHQELLARLSAGHPVRPGEVARVLPSNFARRVQRLYLSELGFADDRIALGNVGRIAHCLGSDPLINLADQLEKPDAEDSADGLYLLIGSGIAHLGAVLTAARPLPPA